MHKSCARDVLRIRLGGTRARSYWRTTSRFWKIDNAGSASGKTLEVRFLRSGYLAGYAQANPDLGLALGLYESDLHAQRRERRKYRYSHRHTVVDQPGRQIRRS